MRGRVLIVAGSDSGGGAGIQADVKTVTALGGYAATAVTALTAQNTQAVRDVVPVPADFVALQMETVLSDIGADCLKTGMLWSADIIEAVVDVIERDAAGTPLVVDPVMVAQGGESLLEFTALEALRRRLAARATVMTPNVPEAERMTGLTIRDVEGLSRAAQILQGLGPKAVLVTGGHLRGDPVTDVLAGEEAIEVFESPRITSRNTHGTGCTLASAIATGLAQGLSIRDAVARARAYVRDAILAAPDLGEGHGPLGHGHTVRPYHG